MLIQGGANVNAEVHTQNFRVETVLNLAIKRSKRNTPEIVSLLLASGADVNAKNDDGYTPLMYAAMKNQTPEVSHLLIQAGAGVNAKNNCGYTPLMYAAMKNQTPEVSHLLIQVGADVNAKNDCGNTPLMYAAINSNNPEAFASLIQAGADVNAKNNSGETALNFAVRRSATYTPEIVSLLLASGAAVSENDLQLAQKNARLKGTAVIEEMKKQVLETRKDNAQ
ncbi:MAG: ankyrin repeat domain-containing protein [Synergistaceae bacterium]|nr:ankyrin repeat domain-containing protein [Synergistaceae bacterium]